jgi:hypothetical protein
MRFAKEPALEVIKRQKPGSKKRAQRRLVNAAGPELGHVARIKSSLGRAVAVTSDNAVAKRNKVAKYGI